MLHTLMIKNGKATYTNQFIPCPRYQIEQELGEEYFPTIGEYKGLVGLLKLSFHPQLVKQKIEDLKQVAPPNTNVLMWNNKFYCLHEANLPMECRMYPDGRLEYLGYETFNGVLDYPVSAHPVMDGEDDLIFHSYSVDEQLIEEHGTMKVGKYNSKQQMVSTYLVPTPSKNHVSFAHSIITTDNFILVWDCSVHFQTDALFYGGSFFKSTKHSLKFGLIPKDAKSQDEVIWIDSHESGAIVHPLHAWEEVEETYQDGKLVSSRTIIKLWSPFSKDLELDLNKANTFHMIEYAIDLQSKSVSREVIDDTINSEFSVMPQRAKPPSSFVAVPSFESSSAMNEIKVANEETIQSVTKKYSTLSYDNRFGFTAILGDQGHFIGYAKWDFVRRRLDSTVYYGKNEVGGEPTVVRAADNKIYIGCYTYNEQESRSSFIIYNEDGEKVCRLQMPYRVPYGFHGQFIPGKDLEKHFEYHENRPSSELKDMEEETYRLLVQQMMTMMTFP